MTVRHEFGDRLIADWAEIPELSDVLVKVTEREIDDIRQPVALIRQKGVSRTPEAPLSHRNYRLLLTLISPYTDADEAQDQLDTILNAALDYLDVTFQHEDAEAVGYNTKLAYDIPVIAIAAKD